MNMPTHIMAKPIGVETNAGLDEARSSVADMSRPGQRRTLVANPNGQQDRIRDRGDERQPREAEAERQNSDLSDNDKVVWVREDTIRPVRDQRRIRKDDDPRGPTRSKRHERPAAEKLERQKDREPSRIHRIRRTENPKARQPEGVKQDNSGIVSGRKLYGAPGKEIRRIATRDYKLGDPFRCNGPKQQNGGRHAALFRETQLAVKPGPIAVSKVRDGKPASMRRSSTKSAVGADMLP